MGCMEIGKQHSFPSCIPVQSATLSCLFGLLLVMLRSRILIVGLDLSDPEPPNFDEQRLTQLDSFQTERDRIYKQASVYFMMMGRQQPLQNKRSAHRIMSFIFKRVSPLPF